MTGVCAPVFLGLPGQLRKPHGEQFVGFGEGACDGGFYGGGVDRGVCAVAAVGSIVLVSSVDI